MALCYLKAYFQKHSIHSKSVELEIIVFSPRDSIDAVVSRFVEKKPEVVGFSCYVWNILKILKTAKALKKKMPGVVIVFGGPEVSPRASSLIFINKSAQIFIVATECKIKTLV